MLTEVEDGAYEDVARVAAALCSGSVVLGDVGYSVGPFTPAVRLPGDGDWAVVDLRGAPVHVAHDAFEAARIFCLLEAGALEEGCFPLVAPTDAEIAERNRYDSWLSHHRFCPPFDRPDPPNPYAKGVDL